MANEKPHVRNAPPFIPHIQLTRESHSPSASIDPAQIHTPVQPFPYNRNIFSEGTPSVSTLPPPFPVAPRVLTRGARKALGLPLESETITFEAEASTTETEHTTPEIEYPLSNDWSNKDAKLFLEFREEHPELTVPEVYR